jgi:hypothetical protein
VPVYGERNLAQGCGASTRSKLVMNPEGDELGIGELRGHGIVRCSRGNIARSSPEPRDGDEAGGAGFLEGLMPLESVTPTLLSRRNASHFCIILQRVFSRAAGPPAVRDWQPVVRE